MFVSVSVTRPITDPRVWREHTGRQAPEGGSEACPRTAPQPSLPVPKVTAKTVPFSNSHHYMISLHGENRTPHIPRCLAFEGSAYAGLWPCLARLEASDAQDALDARRLSASPRSDTAARFRAEHELHAHAYHAVYARRAPGSQSTPGPPVRSALGIWSSTRAFTGHRTSVLLSVSLSLVSLSLV